MAGGPYTSPMRLLIVLALGGALSACGWTASGGGAGSDGSPAGGDLAPTPLPGDGAMGGDDLGDPPDLTSPSKAQVDLVFQGCPVDLTGHVVVVANTDSIAVSRTDQPFSSLQLDLKDLTGKVQLSTAQRVQTGMVVNAIAGTTWTNISSDEVDPISGTLTIHQYDRAAGLMDLDFTQVVLQNPSTRTLCTISGTLKTTGLSF